MSFSVNSGSESDKESIDSLNDQEYQPSNSSEDSDSADLDGVRKLSQKAGTKKRKIQGLGNCSSTPVLKRKTKHDRLPSFNESVIPQNGLHSNTSSLARGSNTSESRSLNVDEYRDMMVKMSKRQNLMDKKIDFLMKQNEILLTTLKELASEKQVKYRKEKEKVEVPGHIRSAVHDAYKSGIEEENLKWTTKDDQKVMKYDSTENRELTCSMQKFVKGLYPSAEDGTIKAAINRYFETIKQREQKLREGKDASHKQKMLHYSRKQRKLKWRKEAVSKKAGWDQEKKTKS